MTVLAATEPEHAQRAVWRHRVLPAVALATNSSAGRAAVRTPGGCRSEQRPARGPYSTAPGEKRQRAIIAAAIDQFSRRGYADATVEDIAAAVGLLKGSLYYYIRTKEDLLFGAILEVHDAMASIAAEVTASRVVSPIARLDELVRRQVLSNASHLARTTVYHREQSFLSAPRRAASNEHREAYYAFVADLIQEGQGAGEIARVVDPRLAAECVASLSTTFYTWWTPDDRVSAAQLADQLARFAVDGVRAGVMGDPMAACVAAPAGQQGDIYTISQGGNGGQKRE
jgi:AcrR family transcriptional regulator